MVHPTSKLHFSFFRQVETQPSWADCPAPVRIPQPLFARPPGFNYRESLDTDGITWPQKCKHRSQDVSKTSRTYLRAFFNIDLDSDLTGHLDTTTKLIIRRACSRQPSRISRTSAIEPCLSCKDLIRQTSNLSMSPKYFGDA